MGSLEVNALKDLACGALTDPFPRLVSTFNNIREPVLSALELDLKAFILQAVERKHISVNVVFQ
jgi:hypothetical protein